MTTTEATTERPGLLKATGVCSRRPRRTPAYDDMTSPTPTRSATVPAQTCVDTPMPAHQREPSSGAEIPHRVRSLPGRRAHPTKEGAFHPDLHPRHPGTVRPGTIRATQVTREPPMPCPSRPARDRKSVV